ncbi:hypothetical protein LTR53_003071 [Teratosphaeriaceae sp. CCFEE 6253]|nr:hypothetical protein LTR53_003071 [Teratosphaeriaceae sp. CCFEE 6253]
MVVSGPSSFYRQLNDEQQEIRLIILRPGKATDLVRCDLHYICLTSRPLLPYETSSYVWGNAKNRGTIILEDRTFDVPASSEAVLRRMRRSDTDRLVWLDAVCINQSDVGERSQQVALMTEIYGNTTRNLIWLGAPASDQEADANVRSLMEVWAHLQKRTDNCDRFFDKVMQARGHAPEEGRLPDGADLIALQRLYDCPWFTRLWVVQEAALPPRSQCHYGEHAIDLTIVTRVAVWLRPEFQAAKLPRVSVNCDTCLRNAARIWSYSDGTQGSDPKDLRFTALGDLLTHLNGFEAFDPRDHVYAMIGLYLTRGSLAVDRQPLCF